MLSQRLKKMKAEAQDESVDTTAPDGVMESLSIGVLEDPKHARDAFRENLRQ